MAWRFYNASGEELVQGITGPTGTSVVDLDGGAPDANYGGTTLVDAGGI